MADYRLRSRSPRTLKVLAEFPRFVGATWTRRTTGPGEFEVVLDVAQLANPLADVATHSVIEVLRDNETEFLGVLTRPSYDQVERRWTLGGPDLLGWWLSGRVTDPGVSEFDSQLDVRGETAMKHYVDAHLVSPTDAARAAIAEISVPFTIEADIARGALVSYSARWRSVLEVTAEIARLADLWQEVVLTGAAGSGYEYVVREPRDRTFTTGTTPLVFSRGKENISEAAYTEDTGQLANAVYALGTGDGAARELREVLDADSISRDFRREAVIDARDADTDAKLDDAGRVTIAQSLLAREQADVQPLLTAAEQYRRDWDVGDDVTLRFEQIGVQLDRRIEEVQVTLSADRAEEIRLSFGDRPQTLGRVLAERLQRNQRANLS